MLRLRSLARPLLTAILIAVGLLLMWRLGLFAQIQLTLTNAYYVAMPTSNTIVIVALDDPSFAEYGRSPTQWSRTVYAGLVERLGNSEARVVAFDLIFSENTPFDKPFADAIKTAREGESRTRFVLASAGVNLPTNLDNELGYSRGVRYDTVLYPNATLDAVTDYHGFVNAFPDNDSRLRRQPSLIQVDNTIGLSFSMATYLAYLRVPSVAFSQVVTQIDNVLSVTADRQIVVDENGFWRQNYFGQPATAQRQLFPIVSLSDVIGGNIDNAFFKDKIVLVGIINSTGVTDQYLVPVSIQPMAGVEIQANAIETLIQNAPLTEQSPTSQALWIVVLAIASTLIYSRVDWRGKLLLGMIFVFGYLIFAFAQFAFRREVFNLLYPSLALVVPIIITIGYDITREITLRIRAETEAKYLEELNRKTEAEKRLLEELNAKTEAEKLILEDLNKLKTHMIRMASHDLKNPLGRVFGYAELALMDLGLDDETRQFIEHVKTAGEEMNSLISEILNLEQLRSGTLQREKLAFNQLVREVITRHDPDMYRKSQTFSGEISDNNLFIAGDTRQLSQAVSNLVGNAIKYTPDGGHIIVRVYAQDGNAHLEVSDTGYGMPPEALPKLFTEFYRVKSEATAGIAGTGLGLSLVKNVVTAHGGNIRVESELGKGSTFFVDVPLTTDDIKV
jgi:signal transduction histidine kinase